MQRHLAATHGEFSDEVAVFDTMFKEIGQLLWRRDDLLRANNEMLEDGRALKNKVRALRRSMCLDAGTCKEDCLDCEGVLPWTTN